MAATLRGRPGDALRAAASVEQALAPSCRWEGATVHMIFLMCSPHYDKWLCQNGGASNTAC